MKISMNGQGNGQNKSNKNIGQNKQMVSEAVTNIP